MKAIQQELFTSVVLEKDRQGREIRDRWDWVEPEVWTDGMLAALETGVKGGKWFSLIINAGPIPTSRTWDCFVFKRPGNTRANLHAGVNH